MNLKRKVKVVFVLTVILQMLFSMTVYALEKPINAEVQLTEEEKEYIKENPIITIAMDTSWVPYAFFNKTSKQVDGILPNMLNVVAEHVGFQVNYVPKESYAEAIKTVQNGETMLVSGIANDPKAAIRNQVNLTEPYILINYSAVTKGKIDDLYVKGAKYKVAVCVGSYSTVAMREKMPSYQFIEYHNNDECMNAVECGEVDVALVATHAAEYYANRHEYMNLNIALINDFSWGLCFGVNQKVDPMLIEILNKGIHRTSEADRNQAIYSGLISANTANSSIMDILYKNPVEIIAMVVCMVSLLLIILFLIIYQKQKTKQIKQRMDIQEDRDKKNRIINSIPCGIGIYEIVNGKIGNIYKNDSYYRLVGEEKEKREKRIGSNYKNSVHPDDIGIIEHAMESIVSGMDDVDFNYRTSMQDGTYTWIRFVGAVVERVDNHILLYCSYAGIDDIINTQQKLQESSAVLEAAIKSAEMSVWNYDMDTHIISQIEVTAFSNRLKANAPNTPESIIASGYVHKESVEAYRNLFHRIGENRNSVQGDFLMKTTNGDSYYWEHIIISPIYDENDNLVKALGTSINITEKKEKEVAYLRQITIMENTVDENLVAKGRHNLSQNAVMYYYAHSGNALRLGEDLSYDDALELLTQKTISHEKADELCKKLSRDYLIAEYHDGRTEGTIEYCVYNKNDAIRWTCLNYIMMEEPLSNDIVIFMYSRDITEQVMNAKTVDKLSELEYEAVGLLDVKTKQYTLKNVRYAIEGPATIGMGDFEERAITRLDKILVPAERETIPPLFRVSNIVNQLKNHDIYYFIYSIIDNEGQIRRKKCHFTYLDEENTTILYCRSDITDVYKKEQEQLQITEQALNAAKEANQAKTEFFSRMSHDMRTPMNGILGLANLSKDEESVTELKDTIKKIEQSGAYLLGLINDTLDFQRIESGKMTIEREAVKTSILVDNVIDMVKQTAEEKGVDLRVINRNARLDTYINVDPLRLKQIFVNLLSNAIKFTPQGGTVEFILECEKRDNKMAHEVIYIRDTGVGMSQDYIQNRIFKPFSQEHNSMSTQYAGSGLGLSIAKNLIEMMGGTIEVESELGVGTTFAVHIDFPYVEEADVSKRTQDHEKHDNEIKESLNGKRILLAEDHPLNAEIAIKLLEKVGCVVTWKQNGEMCVKEFEFAETNYYDAILMDIRMPVMDGIEAAKKIRASEKSDAKEIPIIAMTANAYDEDVKISMQAGMNAHITKPINTTLFYETLSYYIK